MSTWLVVFFFFFNTACICFISSFTMIYKPIFNLSRCSWCTIFVEAGLKIWQEAFLLSCSFQCCNVILHHWRFLGGFLTFFLKLKALSKTFLLLSRPLLGQNWSYQGLVGGCVQGCVQLHYPEIKVGRVRLYAVLT